MKHPWHPAERWKSEFYLLGFFFFPSEKQAMLKKKKKASHGFIQFKKFSTLNLVKPVLHLLLKVMNLTRQVCSCDLAQTKDHSMLLLNNSLFFLLQIHKYKYDHKTTFISNYQFFKHHLGNLNLSLMCCMTKILVQ